MNVFVVPSWFPSPSNPSYGIFMQEQIEMMGELRPDWNIGVSTWGQGDQGKLLYAKDHFKNLVKIYHHSKEDGLQEARSNIQEFYQPTLSWTKRILNGNIESIIRSNRRNFEAFINQNGSCDLISVQASYPGAIIGAYLSERYDVPFHLHVRLGGFMFQDLLNDLGSSLKNRLIQSIHEASLITVTSQFQKETLMKKISKEMIVLHNPVDSDLYQPVESFTDEMVAIGRLEKEKGFDMLLKTIQKGQKLHVVGEGSEKGKLESIVRSRGLDNEIEFHGHGDRTQMNQLLNKCSFLILPSRFETFGNVLLEAMACGRPVLSTSCGGPSEIVTETTGILCEPSINAIRSGIDRMITHRNDYKSVEIRNEVEKSFGKIQWIMKLEELFIKTFER